jgi:hypothetical protein
VNLHQLWFARFDSDLGEDGHQPLAEFVELLLGVPDLADAKVAIGTEADVVVESVRRKDTRLLELADALVVLYRCQGRGGKALTEKLQRVVATLKRWAQEQPAGRGVNFWVEAGRMNRKVNVGGTLREVFSIYRAQAAVLLPVAFWLFLIVAIVNGFTRRNLALFPIEPDQVSRRRL